MSARPPPPICYHYDEDGTPWREGGCRREKCTLVHPNNAAWDSAIDPKTALPNYVYFQLHPEDGRRENMAKKWAASPEDKQEKTESGEGESVEHGEKISAQVLVASEASVATATSSPNPQDQLGKPHGSLAHDYVDDWEADDGAHDGANPAAASVSSGQEPEVQSGAPTSNASAVVPALPRRAQVPRVLDPMPIKFTQGQERRHRDKWNERIRLISICATSSETISALTSDVKTSQRLLNTAALRGGPQEPGNDNENEDTWLFARLTNEHAVLLARLDDEKTHLVETRERVAGVMFRAVCLPTGSNDANEKERERARMRLGMRAKMRRRREERERLESEKVDMPPGGKRKRRWKSAKRKKGMQKGVSGEVATSAEIATAKILAKPAEEQDEWDEWDDKDGEDCTEDAEEGKNFEAEEQEQEEDEVAEEVIEREILAARERERNRREQYELVRSRMARLRNKVAMMKSLLGEMREMARRQRGVTVQSEQRVDAAEAASIKRKQDLDPLPDADERRMRAAPGLSLSSSSHLAQAHAHRHEVHTARVELLECVRQLGEIQIGVEHTSNDTNRNVNAPTEFLRVALDDVRAQRAQVAREREETAKRDRAKFHAEVTEELAHVAQTTVGLNAQAGMISGTLRLFVRRVDDLGGVVEQETRQRDEARLRVEQMKARLQSYAALQAQNSATICALRATLDACAKRTVPSSLDVGIPVSPEATLVPALSVLRMFPTPAEIAQSLVPAMDDTTRLLLDRARHEMASRLKQNSSRMLRTFDARMQQTLNIVEELATRSFPSSGAVTVNIQARAEPPAPVTEDCNDNAALGYTATPMCRPPLSSGVVPALATPTSYFATTMSVADTRPPPQWAGYAPPPRDNTSEDIEGSLRTFSYQGRDPSISLTNVTSTTSSVLINPQAEFHPSPDMDIALPKADTPQAPTQTTQLDCSFLTDPDILGIPVRVQHYKDIQAGVRRPYAFVRIVLPASRGFSSGSGNSSNFETMVEVRDCRKGHLTGRVYRFALDELRYVLPTAKHQLVVCTAPGVDHAQQYYIVRFDAQNECMVRKHPQVPSDKVIYFATHWLAQVAPPLCASESASASPVVSGSGSSLSVRAKQPSAPAAAIENWNAPFDYSPPIWLKDIAFSGVPIQLTERNGDGSILEFISIDVFKSTVEVKVQPLLPFSVPPTLRRIIPLDKVRHVIPCAPGQMVVAVSGYSKGLIMRVEAYGEEECRLYSPLQRRGQVAYLEQRYKTADLAVILPSRRR